MTKNNLHKKLLINKLHKKHVRKIKHFKKLFEDNCQQNNLHKKLLMHFHKNSVTRNENTLKVFLTLVKMYMDMIMATTTLTLYVSISTATYNFCYKPIRIREMIRPPANFLSKFYNKLMPL